MYTKCRQNVSHFSTNFCIHLGYKIKRALAAKYYSDLHKILCRQNYVQYLYAQLMQKVLYN